MRILGLAALLALASPLLRAATPSAPAITPVQAELIADMHARVIKTGGSIYARVTADWHDPKCNLNIGSTLEGHVVEVVPHVKAANGAIPKESTVSLAFTRAQCGGPNMRPFDLLLSAMAAPPHDNDLGMMSDMLPIAVSGAAQPGEQQLVAMHTAGYMNYDFETEIYRFPIVPNMRMGYVAGIRGLRLDVGAGGENSTVLIRKDRDVSLEKHTLLLLIPTEGAIPRTAADFSPILPGASGSAGSGAAAIASAPAEAILVPPPPPIDEINRCEPPQCNVALPSGDVAATGNAAATISIGQLGYASRPQRELDSFDHDEALAYLGHSELLVAFNPHKLVARHNLGTSGSTARIIRVALVDTNTRQVTHTVDWELADNHQFLWTLPDGRVLAHVSSELRVYGPGLKIENRVTLDGPLAYVRVTPNGNFIAAGVIHERHSAELHAKMRDNLEGADPEEDIHILVLNRKFEIISRSTARTRLMAPTLLNEGQLRLQALPDNRYRIALQTWDSQARTVTRFTSSCTPELSSIAPDLIFLVSCAKQTDGREYRVLRPDGKVVLKGDSSLSELGHAAGGSAAGEAFVVKTVQSTLPAPPGATFRADQFSSEELRVYRATDGKRLFAVRVASPTASRDGYALAPDGNQLAVLNRDQIAIYSVPTK